MEKKEKKFNLFGLIINVIELTAVILFICLVYFSYNNFSSVKEGNVPTGYKELNTYEEKDKSITVYDYTVYKIVVVESKTETTYLLRPIFLSDY